MSRHGHQFLLFKRYLRKFHVALQKNAQHLGGGSDVMLLEHLCTASYQL